MVSIGRFLNNPQESHHADLVLYMDDKDGTVHAQILGEEVKVHVLKEFQLHHFFMREVGVFQTHVQLSLDMSNPWEHFLIMNKALFLESWGLVVNWNQVDENALHLTFTDDSTYLYDSIFHAPVFHVNLVYPTCQEEEKKEKMETPVLRKIKLDNDAVEVDIRVNTYFLKKASMIENLKRHILHIERKIRHDIENMNIISSNNTVYPPLSFYTFLWKKPQYRGSFLYSNELLTDNSPLSLLLDVHHALQQPKSDFYGIVGSYAYFHYKSCNKNDQGWGCAYRSFQTICSWLNFQGIVQAPIPTHRDIQTTLVKLGDKPPKFINSNQWIGAIEISYCLDAMYDIQCRILNVRSGTEMNQLVPQIQNHFETYGSPIMVGGGVLAYTLLGIHVENDKNVEYLILDPHYQGEDNIDTIIKKGWCGWKKSNIWKPDCFYNLCLPLTLR